MHDLLIKNGYIVDGTGKPGYAGGVAVQGGRIVEVGAVGGEAKRVIDAGGRVITPGFVDIHTHYDAQISWDPLLTSSCWHGVTTVVMGNCGFSLAPCKPEHREYMMSMLARVEGMSLEALRAGLGWQWQSSAEYLGHMSQKLGLNVASMAGHSTLRYNVMGEASLEREANEEEIGQMQGLLREAVEAGAVGFSTSRARPHVDWQGRPVPSRQAPYSEVLALAMVLREYGFGAVEVSTGFAPDFPAEEWDWLERIAVETGRFVNWPGLYQPRNAPESWRGALARLEETARKGGRMYGVTAAQNTDQEFDLKDNTLTLLRYDAWKRVLQQPFDVRMRLFASAEGRAALRGALEQVWPAQPKPSEWDVVKVFTTRLPQNKRYEGMSLTQLGEATSQHPLDAMLSLAVAEKLETEFVSGGRNFDDAAVEEMFRSPYAVIGISDAGAHLTSVTGAEYGTYFLSHWIGKKNVMSFEEGVRKLTSFPAALMGFTDRGTLAPGMAADICVLDRDALQPLGKERVKDLPGGEERIIVRAKGIAYTMVNGEVLLEEGEHTGAFPGRLLRSTDYMRG